VSVRLSELSSSLGLSTQLSTSHYHLSHPRAAAVDDIFPAPASSSYHSDEGMIELREAGRSSGTGRRPEMTSCDSPLFLTPVAYDERDWQLRRIETRMKLLLSLSLLLLPFNPLIST